MQKPRFLTIPLQFLVACVICIAFVLGSPASAGSAAPLHSVPGYSVTIPAGGTGTITVQAISLSPGTNLSAGSLPLASQPLAADRVRTALYYGIDWGYAESEPYQVALAIWWVQDSNWQSSNHATAERIGEAAVTSPGIPSWIPEGTNLLNLVQSGQASVAPLTLTPSTQNPSLGSGALQVTNRSVNDLTVYLPYGTVFGGPLGQALVWATGQDGSGADATPTSEPQATATAIPAPPTDTPQPVIPTATPVSSKGGGLPPAPPTATTEPPGFEHKGTPSSAATDTPEPPPTDTPTTLPSATATTAPPSPTTVPDTDTPIPAPTEVTSSKGATSGESKDEGQQPHRSMPSSQTPQSSDTQDSQGAKQESQRGNAQVSESAPAPTGEQKDLQPNNVTAESQGGEAAGGAPIQSESSVQGPSLPPSATNTPAGGTSLAPNPVGTTFAPQAVDTSEPSTLAPDPRTTSEVPVPPAQATGAVPVPVITNVATIAPIPTSVPTETPSPTVEKGTGDNSSAGDQKPTVETQATPAPTPAPPPDNDGNGIIDASSGGDSTGSEAAGGNPSTGQGAPPVVSPTTGAGPSSLPMWLGFAAGMMVLGGWVLRRAGLAATAAQVQDK